MTTTMTLQERVDATFGDARLMQEQAVERMTAGDIRDAAEKAWCATKRATDALILARTGTVIEFSPDTTRELNALARTDRALRPMRGRYFRRQAELHGSCFYLGSCEPEDEIERLIRETADYIDEAVRLAA